MQIGIRLAKIYEDKLDGVITEEFWKEQHNRLKEQHEKILITIEAHEKSNISTLEYGIQVLELANNAYNLYLGAEDEEKVKLLKIILSNSYMKDGKLSYEYKKPFDILAKGLSCSKWLPR